MPQIAYELFGSLAFHQAGGNSIKIFQGGQFFSPGQYLHFQDVYPVRKRPVGTVKALAGNRNKSPQSALHFLQQLLSEFASDGRCGWQGSVNPECVCFIVNVNLFKSSVNCADNTFFLPSALRSISP